MYASSQCSITGVSKPVWQMFSGLRGFYANYLVLLMWFGNSYRWFINAWVYPCSQKKSVTKSVGGLLFADHGSETSSITGPIYKWKNRSTKEWPKSHMKSDYQVHNPSSNHIGHCYHHHSQENSHSLQMWVFLIQNLPTSSQWTMASGLPQRPNTNPPSSPRHHPMFLVWVLSPLNPSTLFYIPQKSITFY